MLNVLLFIHILVCFALIGLVLIQRGKGSDIGAAFGSGASNTVFGSTGAGGFLAKATGYLAAAFFVLSLSITYLTHQHLIKTGVFASEQLSAPASEGRNLPFIPD